MASRQRSVEEIIGKLRGAEVALAQGETVAQACRGIGPYVLPMAPAVWGAEARRLREMEAENGRLRRAVADLTLDNQSLKEAARRNF